ncbi:MAG TPA: DUF4162 domain-containing protein, partial [Cellulomonas sp.]|uniref:ATP-binding protein DrrA1-3 family domain-containing protein n=1 Tax=Cellulomonas sp. TaxID=40001 RepID=UPI002E33821E
GSIVAEGTPEELKQRVSGDAVVLTSTRPDDVGRLVAIAGELPGAGVPTVEGTVVEVRVPAGRTLLAGLLRALDADGIDLAGVELRRPTLDDVFLTLTGRSLRDGERPDGPVDHTPTTDGGAA